MTELEEFGELGELEMKVIEGRRTIMHGVNQLYNT